MNEQAQMYDFFSHSYYFFNPNNEHNNIFVDVHREQSK